MRMPYKGLARKLSEFAVQGYFGFVFTIRYLQRITELLSNEEIEKQMH